MADILLASTSNIDDAIATMFSGIKGAVLTSEIKAEDHIALAIVGKPKCGKSWFAASAPGPVFVADFDNRKESLAGKVGVGVKTYADVSTSNPTAIQELESDLANFKYMKTQGKPIPATYVLDSITYMKKGMENLLMKQEPSLARKVRINTTKSLLIPSGYDMINGVRQYLEYFINEFRQLGNVITVWHEKAELDRVKSKPNEPVNTGRWTVDPQYLATVLSTFNEVYRIDIPQSGKYEVRVRADYSFTASTTLKLTGDKKEADLQKILAEHHANTAIPGK
jgi:hypothetical protein